MEISRIDQIFESQNCEFVMRKHEMQNFIARISKHIKLHANLPQAPQL